MIYILKKTLPALLKRIRYHASAAKIQNKGHFSITHCIYSLYPLKKLK
ncbi:hypothetical protein EVA_15267 [gut metagenome]|uniref:Uncharacterized protein n=1 Tax=gut metagenome TaxID=749906 RepID=J9GB39_9ZZZZ